MGVQPPRNCLSREHEDCGLLPRRQDGLRLGTLAAMWPGLTSPLVNPAPLPRPGLGLATPLAAPAGAGIGWTCWPTLCPREPRMGVQPPRTSLPRERELWVASQETSWTAPGDPGRHVAGAHVPERQPRPSSRPGLRSSHAPGGPSRGWDWLDLLADTKPKRAAHGGPPAPKQSSEGA